MCTAPGATVAFTLDVLYDESANDVWDFISVQLAIGEVLHPAPAGRGTLWPKYVIIK